MAWLREKGPTMAEKEFVQLAPVEIAAMNGTLETLNIQ